METDGRPSAPPYPAYPGIAMDYYPGMYPGQQPTDHYSPQQPQTIQTVSQPVSQPVVQRRSANTPRHLRCWHCQTDVITQILYMPGTLTWLMFALVGCVTCWMCSWIPLCMKKCKDALHTCPICGRVIYVHKRI